MNFDRLKTTLHYKVEAAVRELRDIPYYYADATPAEKTAAIEAIVSQFKADLAKEQENAGFNIDAKDSNWQTPLMYAITAPEILEILLKAGANPNATEVNGYTPLHLLASFAEKNPECYILLIAYGADIKKERSSRYFKNRTPLDDYLHETRPLTVGGEPRGRNPVIVALLTNPIPEDSRKALLDLYRSLPADSKRFLFSRMATWLRRRHALDAWHRAGEEGASGGTGTFGGRRHRRRTLRKKQRKARKTRSH